MSNRKLSLMVLDERKKKGMTRKQLSEASGIPICTIQKWEQGRSGMSIDNADKVFKALGIEMNIGGKE